MQNLRYPIGRFEMTDPLGFKHAKAVAISTLKHPWPSP